MGKKGIYKLLAYLILTIIFLLSIGVVYSEEEPFCCITTGSQFSCDSVSSIAQCDSFESNIVFSNQACSTNSSCDTGCCCDLAIGSRYTSKGICDSIIGNFKWDEPDNGVSIEGQEQAYCDSICDETPFFPDCTHFSCQGQNDVACMCGSSLVPDNTYCCANDNYFNTSQDSCLLSPSCLSNDLLSISGTVFDTDSGNPIGSVSLEIVGVGTFTSSSTGTFTLQGITPSSNGTVTATKAGYISGSKIYSITSVDMTNFNIYLELQGVENCEYTSSNSNNAIWNNDQDGCLAKHDSDCSAFINENERSLCGDGVDNDCNGVADCDDPVCIQAAECTQNPMFDYCGDGKIGSNGAPGTNYYGQFENCEVNQLGNCGTNEYCDACLCTDQPLATCNNGIVDSGEECDPNAQRGLWKCDLTESCSPTTCQCFPTQTECGNSLLEVPQEECEFSNYPSTEVMLLGSLCTYDQCKKPDEPGACYCVTKNSCGNGPLELELGEKCDIDDIGECSTCDYGTCQCLGCSIDDKKPTLSGLKVSDSFFLNWSTNCPDSEPNLITEYRLLRCEKEGEACVPSFFLSLEKENLSYIHNFSTQGIDIEYGYALEVIYSSIDNQSSNIVYTGESEIECTEDNPLDYWCANETVMSCVGNKKVTVEECSVGNICLDYPYDTSSSTQNNAMCVYQSICEPCNGVFSMFASEEHRILIEILGVQHNAECSALLTCFVDRSLTSVDKYQQCSGIESCYDYKSENACTGTVPDTCAKGPCEWKNSSKFYELGMGICKPVDESEENCNLCNTISNNKLFGGCSEDLCGLLGDCWFDNKNFLNSNFYNSDKFDGKSCIHKRDMGCDIYDNKLDCLGDTNSPNYSNFSINTNYVSNLPVGVTNSKLKLSNDFFGYGHCIWGNESNIGFSCYKDGDGDKKRDCLGVSSSLDCMRDVWPPVSIASVINPLKKDFKIPFNLIDGNSSSNTLFFNIVNKGEICYPNITNIPTKIDLVDFESGFIEYPINVSGNYTLCYFGVDNANNFEVLKNTTLEIDVIPPQVMYNKIENPYMIWQESENDFKWITDLSLNASINESAYCSLYLTKDGEGLFGGIKISNRFSSSFELNYSTIEDGQYTFNVDCKDLAGNENTNKEYTFLIDADKRISNLITEPTNKFGPLHEIDGISTINLKSTTNESAECRFGKYPLENYSDMTPFETTLGTSHSHKLYYPTDFDAPGIKRFNVRCNFTSKNKVFGNSGDVITFAIDYDIPNTIFTDADQNQIIFDETKWYRSEDISNFYLKCSKTPLYLENNELNTNWAADCKNVLFSYDNNILVSNGSFTKLSPPNGNGIFSLNFQSVDKVNNYEYNSPKIVVVKVDDQEFSFEFKIVKYNGGKPENVNSVTWGITYQVYIQSTKLRPEYLDSPSYDVDINDIGYVVKGKRYPLYNLSPIIENGSRVQKWSAIMKLFRSELNFANLGGTDNGQFVILAEDSSGINSNEISTGKEFFIDTTPPTEPRLDPPFENDQLNNYEDMYSDIFNEKNLSYYTNDKNLFLTGYSNERGKVYFYQNSLTDIYSTYEQNVNSNEDPITFLKTLQKSEKGSNTLVFDGDVSDVYNLGNYVRIFGKERINYTHYNEHYKIVSANVEGDMNKRTIVTIEPPLEFDVSADSENIFVFDKAYPYDWFGVNLNLTIGFNNFYAMMVDNTGNTAFTATYDIYYDPHTPNITLVEPKNNEVISEVDTEVYVLIEELGFGLDEESIKIKINGEEVESVIQILSNDNFTLNGQTIPIYEYKISYDNQGFEDGTYDILFEAKDLASHKIKIEWGFEIDTNVPRNLSFKVDGLTSENYDYQEDTWYMKEVKNFSISFSDNASVIIKSIDLYTVGYGDGGIKVPQFNLKNVSTCVKQNNNFSCHYNDKTVVSTDGEYALKIVAYKILNDSISDDGVWYKYVTTDTIVPQYTLNYDNTTNSNANMTFEAMVTTNEKKLKAYIGIEDDEPAELDPQYKDTSRGSNYLWNNPTYFNWDVGDAASKVYDFDFYLKDLAGNQMMSSHRLLIDNVIPEIDIVDISTSPRYINDSSIIPISNQNDIINLSVESARFSDTAINIVGEIFPNNIEGKDIYDIKKIEITKRKVNGKLFDTLEPPLILKSQPSCSNNCFYRDFFKINDYWLTGEIGYDTPNYVLFKVEDESENIAYFTLVLVKDLSKPKEPDIQIIG